ncbi:uncharacterized protein LOC144657226 [Oculina patagonica]
MDSASSIFGQVIHFVYTWLPETVRNARERKKASRQSKKRVNFSQPVKDKSETSLPIAVLKSSHGLPSTPNTSNVLLLRSLPNTCQGREGFSQEFSTCNLEVVGYKFLSNEKKISKRSALKRWLRQRTNVVQTAHFDGQFYGGSHDLCRREIFECSPRLADSRYQTGHLRLKGKRKLPRRQRSRDELNKTIDEELNETRGSINLSESISVIRLWPSCA